MITDLNRLSIEAFVQIAAARGWRGIDLSELNLTLDDEGFIVYAAPKPKAPKKPKGGADE